MICFRLPKPKIAAAALPFLLAAQLLIGQTTSGQKSPSQTATGQQTSTANQRPHGVHAQKLDGFELARRSSDSATQVAGASRGFGTETTLLSPHKGRAYTLNPLFQWSNPNGKIHSYKFRLLLPDGETVLYETEVSGTSWKYSSDAPPLKPGSSYLWTVQPSTKALGEAAEPAQIMIEGGDRRAKLSDKLSSSPEGSRERAELFVGNRLWYDAVEVYTHLIAATPSDAQLLERRAELYDQLPQTSQAAENDRSRAGTPQQ